MGRVAGQITVGVDRSVGRRVLWPNSFVNSRVKCNLTLTRVKVAARLT